MFSHNLAAWLAEDGLMASVVPSFIWGPWGLVPHTGRGSELGEELAV